jgi:hypothetical protein
MVPPPLPNEFRRRSASHDHCDHYLPSIRSVYLVLFAISRPRRFCISPLLIYKSSTADSQWKASQLQLFDRKAGKGPYH